jgi:t-SNARE complex subunit (syntaxin)
MFKSFRLTNGKTVTVNIDEEETIKRTKERIQDKTGIPIQQQRLIFETEEEVNQFELEAHKKLVDGRSEDIHQIAKELREIREIMNDLAVMVEHQGSVVDTIDVHIEQTAQDAKEGVQELEKAKKYQKRSTCNVM